MGFIRNLLYTPLFSFGDYAHGPYRPPPMRESVFERVYLEPPIPPGWRKTSFGKINLGTGEFIDSHGKVGTHCPWTLHYTDSKGVSMSDRQVMTLPRVPRKVRYVKVGERLII